LCLLRLFKKSLFVGDTPQELIFNNRNANLNINLDRLDQEDEQIKDLLLKMLAVDIDKRPTAEQALNHELFGKGKVPLTPETHYHMTN
jgi:serine/threonine protein kinase